MRDRVDAAGGHADGDWSAGWGTAVAGRVPS
jgi:hypothetical protein